MFENFPYTDMHQLNLDWIIKIAKDFLDQYTHIQELITQGIDDIDSHTNSGLEQLETLANNLEAALNEWYQTHSNDIANQLLQAIADFNEASTAKSTQLLESWPDDYSELVTEYNNLKTALYVSMGLEDKEITYDHVSGYYPINTDEYMDIQKEYKAGTIIKKIVVQNDSATGTNQLKMSFWKQVNKQMVLYKTRAISGVVVDSTIVFDINEKLPYNTYISYKDADIISTVIAERGLVLIQPDTIAFNKTYFETNSIRYQLMLSVYYIENSLPVGLIVHVGEGQDYEEIQDALEDTEDNNLTIILHPRNYPYSKFSMMRSFSDSYPWSGISNVRNISIIGLDIDKCIVEDDSGLYYSPPAEIACNGIIRNVKFIATHNNANYETGDIPSYAVHIDNRPADTNGMRLTFENCIFISYQCAAVGVGVYRNQSITFKNCEFYNKTPNNFSPYTNYDTAYNNIGAIIVHTSMGENKGNDYFHLIGNILVTDNNRYAMLIRETESGPTCTFEFINNTLWNIAHEDTEIKWEGPGTIIQSPYNRLNNNQDINMETYNFPRVINNLNSSSTTDALSAAQGKVLNEKISKQRYSKEYNTSSVTLDQIQQDADTLAGDEVGIYDVGYINTAAANAIGVGIGACFIQLIKHTPLRQILLFTSIATGEYAIVKKDSSTWSSTFANPINTLNNNLKPLTTPKQWSDAITPTLINGTNYGNNNTCYLKIGCFVFLYISVEFNSAPTHELLFTLPEGYRPLGDQRIPANGGGGYNVSAQCIVGSAGGVRVSSSDRYVQASGLIVIA